MANTQTGLQYQAFHTLAILARGGDAAPYQHLVLLEQRFSLALGTVLF